MRTRSIMDIGADFARRSVFHKCSCAQLHFGANPPPTGPQPQPRRGFLARAPAQSGQADLPAGRPHIDAAPSATSAPQLFEDIAGSIDVALAVRGGEIQ